MSEMPPPQHTLFTGKFISVAAQGHWEYATRNSARPAVAVVAITNNDRIVFVEQHRIPVGVNTLELPAGLSGDAPGAENEPLVEAAKRELLEETGYSAERWTELVLGYSSPGLTDECIVIFLAEDLAKVAPGGGDEHENITVHEIPLHEAIDWLLEHRLPIDFKILAGIALAQHRRGVKP
ncbi:MAG: DNA mismatch repair protein MutT [Planctomycetota bacterium]|nr:MAG: DNA mismatch repair protein MutT [Planctomycetota bacterium]